ncbi:MAG: regulatory protein RecX [Rhizobacter sp.]|nr:regulatory protein RecX [Bacteriovorax sp.]
MSQQAYSYLVKILSARDYSEHKLREKLREKKYPANEIDAAISEIKAKGYLREEAFTEGRIRSFMNKGLSINHIRQKLRQEHLEATDEQIAAIFDENQISEDQQIERLARKKMGSKTDLDFEDQGKILRYLISKGHDYSLSKKVLGTLVSEMKIEDDAQHSI